MGAARRKHSKRLGILFGRGIDRSDQWKFLPGNPNCGFFGIFGRHDEPVAAWALASEAIAKATGCPAKCIRTFLESRQGRLFAEGVIELMPANALETAVDAAVARWMRLTITFEGRKRLRHSGRPSVPECLMARRNLDASK
jgi:hypothetical protein